MIVKTNCSTTQDTSGIVCLQSSTCPPAHSNLKANIEVEPSPTHRAHFKHEKVIVPSRQIKVRMRACEKPGHDGGG